MKQEKLWSKDFLFLTLVNFLIFTSFFIYMSTISLYTVNVLNGTTVQGGIAVSIFIIGILISRILVGAWIDRVGRKRVLLTGLLLFSLGSFLYFLHPSIPVLFLIRFFHGIFCGMVLTAANTIAPSLVPKKRRGEGIGYYGMSVSLAIAIGPLLGMSFSRDSNFTMVFLLCSLFAVLSFAAALGTKIPAFQLTAEQLAEIKKWKWSNFIEKNCFSIAIVSFFVGYAYSSIMSFISFYGRELHLESFTTVFFLVNAICILLTRPFLGKLYDRKNANYVLYPALLLLIVGMITFSQVHNGWVLLLAGALTGMGYGAYQLGGQTLSSEIVPPYRMGLGISTFFIFMDSGMAIGPSIHGMISDQFGFSNMYFICGCIFIFSLVLYDLIVGRKVRGTK